METRDEVFQIQNKSHQNQQTQIEQDIVRPDFYLNDEALAELRSFCDTFDPYVNLDLETKFRLQEYGIIDLSNPFDITNKLLLLLENNLQYRIKIQEQSQQER